MPPTNILMLYSFADKPLHCNDKQGHTYGYKDCWEEFMKYAVEMGSGAVIYTPSFINIGSDIQKLV
jgi:hypothetical protein